jgi:hypothetical protein
VRPGRGRRGLAGTVVLQQNLETRCGGEVFNVSERCCPVVAPQRATGVPAAVLLGVDATDNGVDFVIGVVTAITPMDFYGTVMVKDYETLVDSYTKVDVSTGMIAAGGPTTQARTSEAYNCRPHQARPSASRWEPFCCVIPESADTRVP